MQTYITYIHAHLDACTQLCVLVEMLAEAPVACVHIAHTSLMHERNYSHSGQSFFPHAGHYPNAEQAGFCKLLT